MEIDFKNKKQTVEKATLVQLIKENPEYKVITYESSSTYYGRDVKQRLNNK